VQEELWREKRLKGKRRREIAESSGGA